MNVGLVYPVCYELVQMLKGGVVEYFADNKKDILYYGIGITNGVLQYILGPKNIWCKIMMCYLVVNMIMKIFFYLKVFATLTPIVVMLGNVIFDLRIFMLFYIILCALSSQMFCVIGLGNDYESDEGTRRLLKAAGGGASSGQKGTSVGDDGTEAEHNVVEGTEYEFLGLHIGTLVSTLRISIGDFSAIDTSADLEGGDNYMFWIIWLFVMGATCIVFLNFIVAEASASYAKVIEELEEIIWQERASLIAESDGMSMSDTLEKYPKYLITRDVDE